MPKIKRIGLTMRVDKENDYFEIRDSLSKDWLVFIKKLGCIPVLIPNISSFSDEELENLKFQALILTSGGHSNIKKGGKLNKLCNARDYVETLSFNFALKKNIPILGVCRGMQFIYKFYGGSLEKLKNKSHVNKIKKINFDQGESRSVKCFHDFICSNKEIPDELNVFARYSTNQIAGIKHNSKKILGIQWHPERKHPSMLDDFKLIKNFIES